MKKLLCLLGGALLLSNVYAQEIKQLHVGDTIPPLVISHVINYKDFVEPLCSKPFNGVLFLLVSVVFHGLLLRYRKLEVLILLDDRERRDKQGTKWKK